MRINNNLMAYNAQNKLGMNNNSVSNSIRKLSSGLRISRAGDDAAGLAISEKMRGQIRGLNMASKNSQDAISLVQTAEGALNETHAILQRMRELSVQSASDTNQNTVDREALQEEFTALRDEINDIAEDTQFNNKKLLNGDLTKTYSITGSTEIEANTGVVGDVSFSGFTANATVDITIAAGSNTNYTATIGDETVVSAAGTNANGEQTLDFSFADGRNVTIELNAGHTAGDLAAAGLDLLQVTVSGTGAGAQIQTGANKDETLTIEVDRMHSDSIGTSSGNMVSNAAIGNRADAESAITIVDDALNDVSTMRSKLGAYQNRLEHKIKNLDTSSENLQSAESRIRDLDMAKEMTEFTSANILSQAATSMLAQANSLPQGVLKLLG